MSKICLTCKKVKDPSKNITYKISKKITLFDTSLKQKTIFPKDIIPNLNTIKLKPKNANTKVNLDLGIKNKSRYILYFASDIKPKNCSKVPSSDISYNNFKNLGIAKTDNMGNVTLLLRCPNMYKEDNRTFYPHVHFIKTNASNNKWIYKLYAKVVTCNISKTDIKKAIKSKCTLILNSLSLDEFIKHHIPNSYPLPSDKLNKLSNEDIIKYIKQLSYNYNRNIFNMSIIVYCYNSTCGSSQLLIDRLIKIGFKNIKKYSGGIEEWFMLK